MTEVWPVLIWDAHGEGTMLLGVYDSREAAFERIKGEVNMTAWVDGRGEVHGRPARERSATERMLDFTSGISPPNYVPERWAHGYPVKLRSRTSEAATTQPGTVVPGSSRAIARPRPPG